MTAPSQNQFSTFCSRALSFGRGPCWRTASFLALLCAALSSPAASAGKSDRPASQSFSPARSWSAAQATGAPNATLGVDDVHAWATVLADGGPEWLTASIDKPMKIYGIRVVESFNPGAVVRVVVIDESGREVEVWKGVDSTKPPGGSFSVSVNGIVARQVRVELDTTRVAGWNEIDAIGFLDRKERVHWTTTAVASSAYGSPTSPFARYLGRTVTVAVGAGTRLTGRVTHVDEQTLTLEKAGKTKREIMVLREKILYIEATK